MNKHVWLIVGFVATFGFGSAAMAETISIHHAGGCHLYRGVEDGFYIDYTRAGITNASDGSIGVSCPLVRSTTSSNGAIVDVYITHYGEQTTSCTLSSYFPSTGTIRIRTNSWTGTGRGRITVRLAWSSASSATSTYFVDCNLGDGVRGGNAIHMVTLREQ